MIRFPLIHSFKIDKRIDQEAIRAYIEKAKEFGINIDIYTESHKKNIQLTFVIKSKRGGTKCTACFDSSNFGLGVKI